MAARARKRRVIERLRQKFPELTWRYEWPSRWISSAGWEVQAFSQLTPQYDGDDETCRTVYHRSDTNEEIFGFGSFESLLAE